MSFKENERQAQIPDETEKHQKEVEQLREIITVLSNQLNNKPQY